MQDPAHHEEDKVLEVMQVAHTLASLQLHPTQPLWQVA